MCQRLVSCFVLACLFLNSAQAKELKDLKILYVGSERTEAFVSFLEPHVARVEGIPRDDFQPAQAADFDVVLLDWPQSDELFSNRELTSPLGKRERWNKPTVLLGSAGLNLAVAWQLLGGSGCTCLDPIAYDLREHRIFQQPFTINLDQQKSIETPESFRDDLDTPSIMVLPIVDEIDKGWRPGWCTYSSHFDRNPDVEFFCGGVNDKTPTAAALWRQGNLLHFGFEQSPEELNEAGRQMLLNAIAYISDFNEDSPISIVPSVFAGPVARPRATVANWLSKPIQSAWVEDIVSPSVWATLAKIEETGDRVAWAKENEKYLHPNEQEVLTIDEDLKGLDLAFDDPQFVDTLIAELRTNEPQRKERARRLLERYVPDGPHSGDGQRWEAWWQENKSYAFASDLGRYRWYIDPLAKQRKIPSVDLRGEARKDR